jgi:hypothetical protein
VASASYPVRYRQLRFRPLSFSGEQVQARNNREREGRRTSLGEKQEGVAEADEGIGGSAGEADGDVEIDLVVTRKFVGSAKVKKLARTTAFGKIAGIFDEGVPGLGQLAVEVERGLAGEVVLASLRWPIEGDLACQRPMVGKFAGPRQLESGVVAVTRDGIGSAGQTQKKDGGEIETARQRTDLLLDADGDIAEAGSCASSVREIIEVIRDGETEFRFIEETVANESLGEVEDEVVLRVGNEKPVFELKPTLRNNDAGICDRGSVGGNDDFGVWKCLAKKRGSPQEDEREQPAEDVSQSRIWQSMRNHG